MSRETVCLRCAHAPTCHQHAHADCAAHGPVCDGFTTDPAAPPMIEPEPVCCADCGLAYGSEGWMDAHLPDAVWQQITPDAAGILCITCMARRCLRAGLTCPVQIGSGPFATGEPYEPTPGPT